MGSIVSLAMPVYNGEKYVSEAVESILAQDYSDIELIITDNESTDATPDICRDFAARDRRVKYVRNERNLGAAPNYNRGFELATGKYLKWCAHDDRVGENYVSACVAALEADTEAALAFGRTICIDPEGKETSAPDADETPSLIDSAPAARFRRALFLSGTCFPIFGVFRSEILRRSTLHRSYYGSDRALIAEAALLGKLIRVEDAIFYNREHPTRSIRITDKSARSRWQDTSSTSRLATKEHLSLAGHLWEIAGRHPDTVSRLSARMQVLRFEASPVQIRRLALDVVRLASPGLATQMRKAAFWTGQRSA